MTKLELQLYWIVGRKVGDDPQFLATLTRGCISEVKWGHQRRTSFRSSGSNYSLSSAVFCPVLIVLWEFNRHFGNIILQSCCLGSFHSPWTSGNSLCWLFTRKSVSRSSTLESEPFLSKLPFLPFYYWVHSSSPWHMTATRAGWQSQKRCLRIAVSELQQVGESQSGEKPKKALDAGGTLEICFCHCTSPLYSYSPRGSVTSDLIQIPLDRLRAGLGSYDQVENEAREAAALIDVLVLTKIRKESWNMGRREQMLPQRTHEKNTPWIIRENTNGRNDGVPFHTIWPTSQRTTTIVGKDKDGESTLIPCWEYVNLPAFWENNMNIPQNN